jgi:amino acid transporter
MSFTFCFTSVGVICSNALIFDYGINTGGPVVIVWGWVLGSFMTWTTVRCLAEICSTYPVSGSVFHWTGLLAGRKWGPSASYICGWFNLLGNAANDTSFAYGFAQMISATMAIASNGESFLDEKQMVAIAIFSLFLWVVKNILKVDSQGWFNNFSAIY